MRWLFPLVVLMVLTLLFLPIGLCLADTPEPVTATQPPAPIEVGALFTWATTPSPDWGKGALFAALGLAGALVAIFGFIGGAIPGTAGQAKIDADTERLDRLSQHLEELVAKSEPDASAISAVETTVNNLRDDLRGERWRQFWIGAVLYAILGAVFAAMLAQDILQALVLGAGWTALLGTLGLKKDQEERKAIKDAALEKLMSRVRELEARFGEPGITSENLGLEPLDKVERDVRVAQKL